MTRPVVIDVIAKDDASATFRKIAAEQALLGKQTDQTSKSFTQSSQSLRKSQLSLVAAQERYNKVATDGKASVGQLAAAQSALIGAQQRVGKATDSAALAQRRLNNEYDDAKTKATAANRSMGALVTTGLALGPALIPVGAAAAGAVAAAGGAAVTAGLAFLGLRDAWKAGTLQATGLGKQIGVFRDEFDHLKKVAAGAVLPGFTKALHELQPLFAPLNRSVALFGKQIGQVAANVAPGFVRLFIQLQPLFQTFGNLLVQGSAKFARWASSTDSIQKFVAYVQTNLPAVMSTITSLVTTVGHLVAGFAPFGSTSLLAIKLLSQALNAIPVGVLQALIPLLAGAVLGMKAFKAADAAATSLGGLSTKLGGAGTVAKGASGFVGGLGKAIGFLGPVGVAAGVGLGILSGIMGSHAKKAQEDAARVNDLNQALQDGNLRFVLYTQLVKSGAIPAADKLGISQATVYDATVRAGSGMADLRAKLFEATGRYEELSAATQQSATINGAQQKTLQGLRTDLINLSEGVQQAQKDYDAAKKAAADYAKAQGDAALGADILSGKAAANAAALGLTEDAYINGKLAADKKTASDRAATAQMTLEGDAAGLLTQQLNILTDTMLGASDANLGFKLANLQLQQSLKETKGDLSLTTQAGLQNNQAVNQAIRLAEQDGEALAKQEQASKGMAAAKVDGTNKTLADLRVLRNSITAYGGNADAVQALINKLTGYNNTPIPPKPVKIDTAAGGRAVDDIQGKIDGLHGKDVVVKLVYDTSAVGGGGTAIGGRAVSGAAGGRVTGPGSGTSDNVPAWLSNGEFVMRAAAVNKYGANFMENVNRMKFAQGGPINLILPPGDTMTSVLNSIENSLRPTVAGSAPGIAGAPGAAAPGNISGLQAYAYSLFPAYGWGAGALSSLISLWNGESGWNPAAYNASSGATGIPQALPASKMASAGADYLTNGATQIRWGLGYIAERYGSPTNAYSFWLSQSPHWYRQGAWNIASDQLAGLHRGEMVLPRDAADRFRSGGAGVVVAPGAITVYAAPGMDARAVARQAFAELRRWVADEERKAAKGARA